MLKPALEMRYESITALICNVDTWGRVKMSATVKTENTTGTQAFAFDLNQRRSPSWKARNMTPRYKISSHTGARMAALTTVMSAIVKPLSKPKSLKSATGSLDIPVTFPNI